MNSKSSTPIISKTAFNCGATCPLATINYLTQRTSAANPDMSYILDNGTEVGEFARQLFPCAVTVERSSRERQANDTKALIHNGTDVICEASFLTEDLFCAVDILRVTKPGHVEIFEVKSSTKIKDIFYRDIAFQVYVVNLCGYHVDAAHLVYVNKDYVRGDTLDPKQYFITTDVSSDVFNLQRKIADDISAVRKYFSDGNVNPEISECCFRPYLCPFWTNICKKTLPENTVFDIGGGMRIATKLDMFNSGTCTMEDFLKLRGQDPKYVQQCRFEYEKNNNITFKPYELKRFLEKLSFPLISLDFETLAEALPLFKGQKAYDQTVFLYSMHILRNYGDALEHFDYIADPNGDWRVSLAHALVKCCPSEGSVLVWNATMEKNRILEFADMEANSDIKNELISIADRILDLMVPFRQRVIYQREMRGSYSLKKVFPALCPDASILSYDDFLINNGLLASSAYHSFVLNPHVSDIEREYVKRELTNYCAWDTYTPLCILAVMFKLADRNYPFLFKKTERHD